MNSVGCSSSGGSGKSSHRIYLSGPLFSAGEIAWGKEITLALRERLKDVEVIWPYESSSPDAKPDEIYRENLQSMDRSDIMVAILDGPGVDDGTAWEIGYFSAQGKRILGIRTDTRKGGESYSSRVNLMIECSCLRVASDAEELYSELERLLV